MLQKNTQLHNTLSGNCDVNLFDRLINMKNF